MKRKELAREFARTAHLSTSAAQDQVDELVDEFCGNCGPANPSTLLAWENWLARPAASNVATQRS